MVFRRNTGTQERDTHRREIVASLEKTGLDRETTLILGGGALALAGIRRASDLDLMVPHSTFRELAYQRHTPSGLHLQNKFDAYRPFLETVPVNLPSDMMALDITHPHGANTHTGSPELDEQFLTEIDNFDDFEGFRFLPPELVVAHRDKPDSPTGRKARRDQQLVKEFLKNSRS